MHDIISSINCFLSQDTAFSSTFLSVSLTICFKIYLFGIMLEWNKTKQGILTG